MTIGNVLYLLMSIGMFAVFSVVLAYQSWQQSRVGPEVVPASGPAPKAEPHHAITA